MRALKQAMKRAEITQIEMARRTKRSESEISLIVNGKREASLATAKAIAKELNAAVETLFFV